MSGLTALVTTYNEGAIIAETLGRLSFADEILVVDSFSEDDTPNLARTAGARVLQHEYESPSAQKNWALPQAKHDWVLLVDADEWVTPELADEVRRTIADAGRHDGYEIKRRNFFLGREIKHSGWQRDWVLRLVRRDRAQYADRHIHEVMEVQGETGRLRACLLHHSYRTMDDYWRKLRRYADWNAREARRNGRTVSAPYLILHPPLRFLRAYLLQGGFLDGTHGAIVSLLTAVYAAAKDIKVWELQQGAREAPAEQEKSS
ncbi:MAG: glycosyltransferase family 2 protein [Armatimonadetes bacterium]|nr:glycosyltransferase family 2 protein [Armatimonadota bacterium]